MVVEEDWENEKNFKEFLEFSKEEVRGVKSLIDDSVKQEIWDLFKQMGIEKIKERKNMIKNQIYQKLEERNYRDSQKKYQRLKKEF